MKVSIIIPCYNASHFVSSAVSHCLNQHYTDIEIILVNDGSTDDTVSQLDLLQSTHGVLKVFTTENRGAAQARKYGLDHATGEFVFFMDVDDELLPNAVWDLVQKQKEDNYDIVIGQHYIQRGGKKLKGKTYTASGNNMVQNVKSILMGEFPIFLWGQLYRKSLLDQAIFYNYAVAEDLLINTQLVISGNIKISSIDSFIYNYIVNNDSLSQMYSLEKTTAGEQAYRKSIELVRNKVTNDDINKELCFSELQHLYALIILGYSDSGKLYQKIKENYSMELSAVLSMLDIKRRTVLILFSLSPFLTQYLISKRAIFNKAI